jgi:hypothetical protein
VVDPSRAMLKANEKLYNTTRRAFPAPIAPEPPPLDSMWKTLTIRQMRALSQRIGTEETIRFVKTMQEREGQNAV